jgi:hypothetical protein
MTVLRALITPYHDPDDLFELEKLSFSSNSCSPSTRAVFHVVMSTPSTIQPPEVPYSS